MRNLHLVAALAASMTIGGCAYAAGSKADAPLSEAAQKALAGYEPVGTANCIPLSQVRSSRIIDPTAIIYEITSNRLYVNQPAGGRCTGLRKDRALVTRITTGNLCNLDLVTVIDPPSPIQYGACPLGTFTEYRKKQ